jgi:hypothetical protein
MNWAAPNASKSVTSVHLEMNRSHDVDWGGAMYVFPFFSSLMDDATGAFFCRARGLCCLVEGSSTSGGSSTILGVFLDMFETSLVKENVRGRLHERFCLCLNGTELLLYFGNLHDVEPSFSQIITSALAHLAKRSSEIPSVCFSLWVSFAA